VIVAAEANGMLDSGEDIICVRGVSQLNIIKHFLVRERCPIEMLSLRTNSPPRGWPNRETVRIWANSIRRIVYWIILNALSRPYEVFKISLHTSSGREAEIGEDLITLVDGVRGSIRLGALADELEFFPERGLRGGDPEEDGGWCGISEPGLIRMDVVPNVAVVLGVSNSCSDIVS